jgi:hypothetical protein
MFNIKIKKSIFLITGTNIALNLKPLINFVQLLTPLTHPIQYHLNLIHKGIHLPDVLISGRNQVLDHPLIGLHQDRQRVNGAFAQQIVVEENSPCAHFCFVLGPAQNVVEGFCVLHFGVVGDEMVQDLAFVVACVQQLHQGETLEDQGLLVVTLHHDLCDPLDAVVFNGHYRDWLVFAHKVHHTNNQTQVLFFASFFE